MGLLRWIRLPFESFESNLKTFLMHFEDDSLEEEDPIGEFLSLKAKGAIQLDDEDDVAEAEAGAVVQDADADKEETVAQEPSVVNLREVEDEQEGQEIVLVQMPDGGDAETDDRSEDEAGRIEVAGDERAPALMEEEQDTESVVSMTPDLEAPGIESSEDEAVATGEDVPTTGDVKAGDIPEAEQKQEEESQEGDEVDALLDVFREEQVLDSPISALSRELDDTSVYSLLDEMKRIADRVRRSSAENR